MSRSIHSLLLTLFACSCRGGHDSGLPSSEPPQTENVSTSIVRLEHANATEVAATLDEILEASTPALEGRWRGISCALPHPGTQVELWRAFKKPLRRDIQIRADPQSNSLVLSAESEIDLARVTELIRRLEKIAARPR